MERLGLGGIHLSVDLALQGDDDGGVGGVAHGLESSKMMRNSSSVIGITARRGSDMITKVHLCEVFAGTSVADSTQRKGAAPNNLSPRGALGRGSQPRPVFSKRRILCRAAGG